MKYILSIQSHVAFGHVGNAAAVFPLQRLGHEVIAVHTVQFSNHTGYGEWTGDVFSADHIARILDGLSRRIPLNRMDALLTGYLGDPAIGDIILSRLPAGVPWICDPVMGDVGRGFFVREGIPAFFRDRALTRAAVLTPNQFELEYLSGVAIETLEDAREACLLLHKKGVETILLTSLFHTKTPNGTIQMMASAKSGEAFLATTPRLPIDPAPNGAGDFTAAVFAGHRIAGLGLEESLRRTAGSVLTLFEKTYAAGQRELALIAAQDGLTTSRDDILVEQLG